MPRISVIVPTYNRRATLARCVAALRAQDYPEGEREVIVVDNNSTDGSTDFIRHEPGVVLLREPRQGAYAARNRGLRRAAGEIVAFTDADCVPRHDWLARIDEAMRDPGTRIVLGRSEPAWSSPALRLLGAYEHYKERYVFGTGKAEVYYGRTNNMAVRRETFDAVGPFAERQRGADAIFVQRAVDRFGCDAVRYEGGIHVQHAELDRPREYFRKVYLYGRSRRRHRALAHIRPLTTAERLRVFRDTVRGERPSAAETVALLALLVVGAGSWTAGDLAARLRSRDVA